MLQGDKEEVGFSGSALDLVMVCVNCETHTL